MRLKTTAVLGCGLLMMYSGISYKANEEKAEPTKLSIVQEMTLDQFGDYDKSKGFTRQKFIGERHIFNATKFLNKNIHSSLVYLKSALGEDVPKNYDSNEITITIEKVINKYSRQAYCLDLLLGLAKEADKYERKETAGDILKKELDDLDERDCSDSFKYHLWMVYGIEHGKTDSIEATHKNLKDFYRKNDLVNYDTVAQVFRQIERKFPENKSRFEDMVIQKNHFW